MTHFIVLMYASLFMFALNGIMLMGLRNRQRELKVAEERILRLMMRSKLRRK